MLYLHQSCIKTNLNKKEIFAYKSLSNDFLTKAISMLNGHGVLNHIDRDLHIDLLFVNKDKMAKINKQYRGIDNATNVISLQFLDNVDLNTTYNGYQYYLGTIFICIGVLIDEASMYGEQHNSYLIKLLLHGLLHLLGYDHQSDEQAKIMEDMEDKILKHLNINTSGLVKNHWRYLYNYD